MANATFPIQSLGTGGTGASVTSTSSSGVGTTEAAAGFSTHSAVFTVSALSILDGDGYLNLVIEGNLDGSTWVPLASTAVQANGAYLLVPVLAGVSARIPVANLRASAYFEGFGTGSPTATVIGWIASQA